MLINTRQFRNTIWKYYKAHKRAFPWRETKDPYKILVSEIMLQQTQTDRVVKKYEEWLEHFPTFKDLADAPLQKVLKIWQGLGYNRRALALKRAAAIICEKYNGKLPANYEKILELPGIGPYTAGAIMAFAFNKPFPIIETNIRTVFIYFYKKQGKVPRFVSQAASRAAPSPASGTLPLVADADILLLVEKTLDKNNPREWYHALMDYGVMLKKTHGNLNKQSRHYTKQSSFIGSNRQIRSTILKAITLKPQTQKSILSFLELNNVKVTSEQFQKNISALQNEGFIVKRGQKFDIL
ncbi:A/G-specific adenine glycosylase [Candidatus Parcubacteria bacterium]|nr:A/G-specific adenine glycosylase [Candidatus Parcubacteria bacterium]